VRLEGVTPLPFGLAWVARELRPCTLVVCQGAVWQPLWGPIFRRQE
jgi:hypothetical protein